MNEYAINKSNKDPNDLAKLINHVSTRKKINENRQHAEASEIIKQRQGIFALDYRKQFTVDGSLKTKVDPRNGSFSQFYSLKDRISTKGNDFILRGARYLVSIDPTLVVSQKVRVLERDFMDALAAIEQTKIVTSAEYFLELAGVLDYLKNAVVTTLNALLQEEKLGKFKLNNPEYQLVRSEIFELTRLSTQAFYSHLVGDPIIRDEALSRVTSSAEKMKSVCSYILKEYKNSIFSAKYFTRPEASHPLVIMSAAFTVVRTVEDGPDTIIGLPSGGTEIAFVQQLAYKKLKGLIIKVILIPLSLHSVKEAFSSKKIDDNAFIKYLQSLSKDLKDKRLLLVEDNSSTGKTIQKLTDLLMKNGATNIEVAVSEADIIRSTIDLNDPKRTHVASEKTYERAVGVLPISKTIKPKVDIKEIIERRRLIRTHSDKKNAQGEKVPKFIETVFEKMTSEPTEIKLSELNETNSILTFRRTFLSNFYACKVTYNGIEYSSVEHAYQAQKFTPSELQNVKNSTLDEIHEALRIGGVIRTYKTIEEIFNDPNISSGNIKLIADILRTHGHVCDDWDEMRVPIMASLLLQKYSHPDLRARLQETGDKYLIEGNTWGDTLWGISDNRGRNMLGQMLMAIRNGNF